MKLKELKIKTITPENSHYPSLLKEIPNPASRIYVLGELPAEPPVRPQSDSDFGRNGPKIAIVGTRKATSQGRSIAKEMAKKLSEQGIIIVSGLAMGIDTASHEGALAANGQTIAVLACGLDTIYPYQNESLARKILELGGAIISEYPVGTPAFPNQFLERNRIISGLSIATIIIEAPKESGALVTARLAAEQGREVFVVPGPINHPNYYGSHQLIRDGARLVSSVDDILEDLQLQISNFQFPISKQIPLLRSKSPEGHPKFQTNEEKIIFETLKEAGQPLNIDKIIGLTKLEPQVVNQAIAILIINGFVKESEKGYTI